MHFLYAICRLYPAILIALFNNINVISKSEVVHSITMNTYSTVFSILDFIHYSLQEQSKMIVVTMDRLFVYYQLSSETIHSDGH